MKGLVWSCWEFLSWKGVQVVLNVDQEVLTRVLGTYWPDIGCTIPKKECNLREAASFGQLPERDSAESIRSLLSQQLEKWAPQLWPGIWVVHDSIHYTACPGASLSPATYCETSVDFLISLCLRFFISKVGISINGPHRVVVRIKWVNKTARKKCLACGQHVIS